MRRLIVLLLSIAVLAPAAVVASGCGAEEAAGVDVAQAARKTADKQTARMAMAVRVEGLGLPMAVSVKADGVTALDAPRMRMDVDLAELLAFAGQSGAAEPMEIRLDGSRLFVRPPELPAITIPGGKPWVAVDLRGLAGALGLDADGLGDIFTMEPSAQLRALKAAKGMEEVGREQVGGEQTTHHRGTITPADIVAALPADRRPAAEKALRDLERLGGEQSTAKPAPVDFWVGDDGILRRMRSSQTLPAQKGTPAGSFSMDITLSDFGVPLDVAAPPKDDTWDATSVLAEVLSGLAGAGG